MLIQRYSSQSGRHAQETADIEKVARAAEEETRREERRAIRLDLGEGFLELGLVLSSLYFLSRRRFFPALGFGAEIIGTILGAAGFLV